MNKLTNYNTKDLYNFYAYLTTQKEFNLYNYDYDDKNLYNVIVLNEINNDLCSPTKMFRLLQGDVGSGKTIVSLLAALNAINSNFQVAFMAPTEILAKQHYFV